MANEAEPPKKGLVFHFDPQGRVRVLEHNLTPVECLALLQSARAYERVRGEELLRQTGCLSPLPYRSN